MSSIPEPTPSDIETLRRKADDFARKAFADILKRATPLIQPQSDSETTDTNDDANAVS